MLLIIMENAMKKIAILLVVACAMSVLAQDKPAQDKPAPNKPDTEKAAPSGKIQVTMTSISLEKYGPMKEDKTFRAGDSVFINLELKGLQPNDQNQVVVQADLVVPQLSLDRKNLIDDSTDAEDVVPMYFLIPIGSVQQEGLCYVTITIRDMVAKTFTEFKTEFKLAVDKKAPQKPKKK